MNTLNLYRGWWLVGLSSLLYVYDFILRVAPGVLALAWMEYFDFNAWEWSFIQGLFYYGYAFMQIPSGMLVDRYGAKKPLVWGCLISALCMGVTLYSRDLFILSLSRLCMGMAASVAYVGPLVLARRYLPLSSFGLASGWVQVLGCLGAIVGTHSIYWLYESLGLMLTCQAMVLIGFIISALFIVIIPNETTDGPTAHIAWTWVLRDVMHIARTPFSYRLAWLAFALWAPIVMFLETWGLPWLTLNGISGSTASQLLAWGWVVIAIAGPLWGYLDAKGYAHAALIRWGLILNTLGTLCWMLIPWHPLTSWIAVSCFALGSAAQCITFAVVAEHHPQERMGTAIGFNNMAIVSSGFTLLPLAGYWLHTGHADLRHAYGIGQSFVLSVVISALILHGLPLYRRRRRHTHDLSP